jgi:DNA invertase Pin-like site-specific DNA recombinase
MQREAISRAATARGDDIRFWREETRSVSRRSNAPRPALDELRELARAGALRRLYVFRLDRLTRTGIRDTLALVEELRAHGVELVTLADGFDVAGPAGDVVIAVMAWAAQMERAALGERISAARARVEATGGTWGRPRRVDTATEERILALLAEGTSTRKVASALKIPRSTVRRVGQKGHPKTALGSGGNSAAKKNQWGVGQK